MKAKQIIESESRRIPRIGKVTPADVERASAGGYEVEFQSDEYNTDLAIVSMRFDGSVSATDAENSAEIGCRDAGLTRNNLPLELTNIDVSEEDDSEEPGHYVMLHVDYLDDTFADMDKELKNRLGEPSPIRPISAP